MYSPLALTLSPPATTRPPRPALPRLQETLKRADCWTPSLRFAAEGPDGPDAPNPSVPPGTPPDVDGLLQTLQDLMGLMGQIQQIVRTPEEQTAVLSAVVWSQWVQPWLAQDRAATHAHLAGWEADIHAQGAPGLIRQGALGALRFVRSHLDRPEVLQRTNTLVCGLLVRGGWRKVMDLLQLASTDAFARATPVQKGQQVVETLGPVFIKALQTLSTIPNLFDPTVQQSLTPLYQDITPLPFATIQATVEKELGRPLVDAYAWFDPQPLKTGSMAQVHRARLHSGQEVAVKVLKPGVAQSIQQDWAMITPLAQLLGQMAPAIEAEKRFATLGQQLLGECDMVAEAEKLTAIAQRIAPFSPPIDVPTPIQSHTTGGVLTMSFIRGEGLTHFIGQPAVAAGYFQIIADQLFTWGVCQVDPHPGNVPYDPWRQRFGFLDAGQVYFLTPADQRQIARALVALVSGAPDLLAQSFLDPAVLTDPAQQQALTDFRNQLRQTPNSPGVSQRGQLAIRLGQVVKAAQTLNLPLAPFPEDAWRTLFTGWMVAQTLAQGTPGSMTRSERSLLWTLSRRLWPHLRAQDKRFLMQAGWHVAYTQTQDCIRDSIVQPMAQHLDQLRRWWRGN